MDKPVKKSDKELFSVIENKIKSGQYIIKNHARIRMIERSISDVHVLSGLLGLKGYSRKRNKRKDNYENGKQDWNYCIECNVQQERSLRIIISFYENLMPIITVMWLGGENGK